MNNRLQLLIDKGYQKEAVLRLSSFTDDELNVAAEAAFKHISGNCSSVTNPQALFVGGQPGCGKSSMSLKIKSAKKNTIGISIDYYRMYHPKYLEMEKYIRRYWEGRKETVNDSPGSDMANMTHLFASAMTDKLIDLALKNKYNMLIEWGMREPKAPLKTMKLLKHSSYRIIVMFVATNKDLSYSSCNLRNDFFNDTPHIIRKVPKSFHDLCVSALPESIDIIYQTGKEQIIYDDFIVVDRKGKKIWNNRDEKSPGLVFKEYLNY